MRKIRICLVLLLLVLGQLQAQPLEQGWRWIGRLGLSFGFGQPVNRLGCFLVGGGYSNEVQFAASWRGYYHWTRLGPPQKGWEQQWQLGGQFGFGPPLALEPTLHGPSWAIIPRQYALGYSVAYYQDKIETSQWTGGLSSKFGPWQLQIENDALVPGSHKDQYRSGGLQLVYQRDPWLLEWKMVLWHGQTRCEGARNVRPPASKTTDYRCRFGYRDFSPCRYGQYSHGILMGQVGYVLPYGQVAQVGLGVDAEQVRHLFQNLLIHDLWFIPKKWNKARNPHYPMLDREGCPVPEGMTKEVRPPRLVWVFGGNNSGIY